MAKIFVLAIILALLMAMLTYEPLPEVQTRITYYRQFSTYETRIGDKLTVVSINAESDMGYPCDAWDEENEEGQRCVIVGDDSIKAFLVSIR